MPTVAEVWRAVFPAARAVGADAAKGRDVNWVRVMKARVPAFDALEAGDLAILPQPALRDLAGGTVEAPTVVEAVARAGGVGVIVIGPDDDGASGAEALERAAALGLGAFRLATGDAAALERSVIGYLVNGRAELERQAGALEAQLERIALEGHGLDAHAAAIARFLGRAVAIEGRRGELLVLHAPADVPATAAAATRYLGERKRAALTVPLPAVPRAGAGALGGHGRRNDAPARRSSAAGERSGALVLLGPGAPTELDRIAADRVAALLALELARGAGEMPSTGTQRRDADALPTAGPPWIVVMARQVTPDAPTSLTERERVRGELRRIAPASRLGLRGDAASLELRLVVAADDSDRDGHELAARIATTVGRPVAVSRPFTRPEERPVAEGDARATLEVIEGLGVRERATLAGIAAPDPATLVPGPPTEPGPSAPEPPLVARADRLPAYRLLSALHAIPDGIRQARALLAPLLVGRAERQAERLATLRAVLDHPGLTEAAAALGVHRNTLAYRMARIEQATGWRLEDPTLRFGVALAVRIVQKAQEADAVVTSGHPSRSPSRR